MGRKENQAAYSIAQDIRKAVEESSTDYAEIVSQAVKLADWVVSIAHDEDALKSLINYPPK